MATTTSEMTSTAESKISEETNTLKEASQKKKSIPIPEGWVLARGSIDSLKDSASEEFVVYEKQSLFNTKASTERKEDKESAECKEQKEAQESKERQDTDGMQGKETSTIHKKKDEPQLLRIILCRADEYRDEISSDRIRRSVKLPRRHIALYFLFGNPNVLNSPDLCKDFSFQNADHLYSLMADTERTLIEFRYHTANYWTPNDKVRAYLQKDGIVASRFSYGFYPERFRNSLFKSFFKFLCKNGILTRDEANYFRTILPTKPVSKKELLLRKQIAKLFQQYDATENEWNGTISTTQRAILEAIIEKAEKIHKDTIEAAVKSGEPSHVVNYVPGVKRLFYLDDSRAALDVGNAFLKKPGLESYAVKAFEIVANYRDPGLDHDVPDTFFDSPYKALMREKLTECLMALSGNKNMDEDIKKTREKAARSLFRGLDISIDETSIVKNKLHKFIKLLNCISGYENLGTMFIPDPKMDDRPSDTLLKTYMVLAHRVAEQNQLIAKLTGKDPVEAVAVNGFLLSEERDKDTQQKTQPIIFSKSSKPTEKSAKPEVSTVTETAKAKKATVRSLDSDDEVEHDIARL